MRRARDITLDNLAVNNANGWAASAFHFYHGADRGSTSMNAWNVWVRRMTVTGTQQALLVWETTAHDILFEDVTISNARAHAVRYEYGSAYPVQPGHLDRLRLQGFFSSKGTTRPASRSSTRFSTNATGRRPQRWRCAGRPQARR